MIERMDAPAGVLAFRFSGDISRRDYDEVLIPPLKEAIERGEELRCLVQVGPGFDEYEAGAVWADLKTGFRYGVSHHKAWRRMALVTDVEWIVKAIALLGWMAPGELKLFDVDDLDDAKAWVSGP
jgi:SpoIIAA-like